MAYKISADDVRYRLQLTSTELPDTTLNSAGFIPAGQAWVIKKLASVGKEYDSLDAEDKLLADAAGVSYVAARVYLAAAKGQLKVGNVSHSSVSPSEMEKGAQALLEETREYLAMLGIKDGGFYVSGSGHDTYLQEYIP